MDAPSNASPTASDALIVAGEDTPALEHSDSSLPAFALASDPEQVIADATRAARAVMAVIQARPGLVVRGKRYAEFDHWQTIGRFYGVTTRVEIDRRIEDERGQPGWEAWAVVVHVATGQIVSRASAQCTRSEERWQDREDFQLRSMAQTRAQAKAYRSCLGFVMVLAGIESTPAEELGVENERENGGLSCSRRDEGATGSYRRISTAQRKRLYAIWKGAGWDPSEVRQYLVGVGQAKGRDYSRSEDVGLDDYDAICAHLEGGPKR